MWCAPCQELAAETEATYGDYRSDDFVYLTVLHEDVEGDEPDLADVNEWAETFEITAPVTSDPFGESGTDSALRNGQYPAEFTIDRDMRVHERIEELVDARLRESIESIL